MKRIAPFIRQGSFAVASPRAARYLSVFFYCLVLSLAGCASQQVKSCESIAGEGWKVLDHPPKNAAGLLSLQGVEPDNSIVWLGHDSDRVMACHYQPGMTSPGCSESRGYEFIHKKGTWEPGGVVLNTCDANE